MAHYKLLVLADPVEGREDEFNDWYANRHLADVVAVPGYVSAQRFRLTTVARGAFQNRYLAIYDMETEDAQAAIDELLRLGDSGEMFISEALDDQTLNVGVFEAITERVTAR
jgi:hypothetical protein